MATDNYLEKLIRTVGSLQLAPGSRADVLVVHDDCCQFLRGGHCNCEPTLTIVREGENIH